MNVLVTGATGLLGRQVVAELLRQGHHVRAGVRRPVSPEACLADGWTGVEQVLCDVSAEAGLAVACAGVDAVIHLAADMRGSDDEKIETAVGGTRRLLAAMTAPYPRFLLASSFSVYDWDRVGAQLSEQSPLLDATTMLQHEAYARAKVMQEMTARDICAARGIALTVLRPALIWSDVSENFSCVGPRAGPLALVVAPGRTLRLTHVRNCAAAFVAALGQGARGGTFNIDDGFAVSAWGFATRAGGRWRLPLPYPVMAGLTGLAAVLLRPVLGGRRMPGLLIAQRLRARFHPARAGHAALHAATGWTPWPPFQDRAQ